MAKKPIAKLQPSKLDNQKELLEGDLDLENLKLAKRTKASLDISESVIGGDVVRTIEGASTVTIKVNDRSRAIRNSGMLGSEVDIKIDGLWFRLVKVGKSGNDLNLVFEDREVAVLRTYNKKKVAGWGKTSRAAFARSIVREVKELNIPFICPELDEKEAKKPKTKKAAADKGVQRDFGFGARTPGVGDRANDSNTRLTIKGSPASKNQLLNVEEVLDAGRARLLPRKLLVCSIMTIITESSAVNVPYGDRDSVGLFQQRESWGTKSERMNPTIAAGKFFDQAVKVQQGDPNIGYGELCQAVQVSAFSERYAKYRTEAERLVTAYGVSGDSSIAYDSGLASANLMTEWGEDAVEYQFSRGFPKQLPGGKKGWAKEGSWECLQRLADEVNIRCFVVSGKLYFIGEPRLFSSAPRARISEDSDGVDWIDFDYDTGKPNAKLRITARLDRWAAPPGTIIEIFDNGPVNGRWLVAEIRRGFFSDSATITCKKPRARLPEPTQEDITGLWDNPWNGQPDPNAAQVGSALGDFVLPLDTKMPTSSQFNVVDPEGAPDATGTKYHAAMDWMAPGGDPVLSPHDGVVVEAKPSRGNTGQVFGGVVKIQNDRGYVWVFRHVDPAAGMIVGQQVSAGTKIANITSWLTNIASSHAHIEVWKTLEGGYRKENMIDPLKYINDIKAGLPV